MAGAGNDKQFQILCKVLNLNSFFKFFYLAGVRNFKDKQPEVIILLFFPFTLETVFEINVKRK